MRNWAFLLSGRAQKIRAIMIISATAVLFVAMFASFRQMPQGGDRQVYSDSYAAMPASPTAATVDALAQFGVERTQSRIAQFEALDKLIDGADKDAGAEAAKQKMALVGYMETETTLEGVLRAQGFDSAICTVHSDSCNVLVRAQSLDDAQTARILSAAAAETGLSAANIKIIPVA